MKHLLLANISEMLLLNQTLYLFIRDVRNPGLILLYLLSTPFPSKRISLLAKEIVINFTIQRYMTHEMKAVKRGESQGKESLDEDLDIHEKEAPRKI
jgi:hypothetical protein